MVADVILSPIKTCPSYKTAFPKIVLVKVNKTVEVAPIRLIILNTFPESITNNSPFQLKIEFILLLSEQNNLQREEILIFSDLIVNCKKV